MYQKELIKPTSETAESHQVLNATNYKSGRKAPVFSYKTGAFLQLFWRFFVTNPMVLLNDSIDFVQRFQWIR